MNLNHTKFQIYCRNMTTEKEIEEFEEWFSKCIPKEEIPIEDLKLKITKFTVFFNEQHKRMVNLLGFIDQKCTEDEKVSFGIESSEKFDKRTINKNIKKFRKKNPNFKQVKNSDESDAVLLLDASLDFKASYLITNDVSNKNIINTLNTDNDRIIYLKNTNPHDGKRTTETYLHRKKTPAKKPHK